MNPKEVADRARKMFEERGGMDGLKADISRVWSAAAKPGTAKQKADAVRRAVRRPRPATANQPIPAIHAAEGPAAAMVDEGGPIVPDGPSPSSTTPNRSGHVVHYAIYSGDEAISDAGTRELSDLSEAKAAARQISAEQPDALISVRALGDRDVAEGDWAYPYAAVFVDGVEIKPEDHQWPHRPS
jgi:hypothetical protein